MKFILLVLLLVGCTSPEAPAPLPPPVEHEPTVVELEVPPATPFDFRLGKFSTFYNKNADSDDLRGENIKLAASRFNKHIIPPGGVFSFNKTVGPRTEEAGFGNAPVIFLGVLEPGIGGGVCQVSSTLNGAVLKAGLKPLTRYPHSRPSTYIMPGLDATVSWPNCDDPDCIPLDYTFKNTYDFPIGLTSKTEVQGVDVDTYDPELKEYRETVFRLTIEVWGQESVSNNVEFHSSYKETKDYKVRYRRTMKYRNAYKKRVQKGSRGQHAILQVNSKHGKDFYHSDYPPVDEVWEIGMGYELTENDPWASSSSPQNSKTQSSPAESSQKTPLTGTVPTTPPPSPQGSATVTSSSQAPSE